jgi:hypothetical protein
VQLLLNVGRVRLQRVWETKLGVEYAMSVGPTPLEVYEATADGDDEAEAAWYRDYVARADASREAGLAR